MKRMHKLKKGYYNPYNFRNIIANDYDAFRQFAFAIDFKPTTIFFGEETRIYFNEMAWSETNIKIRL